MDHEATDIKHGSSNSAEREDTPMQTEAGPTNQSSSLRGYTSRSQRDQVTGDLPSDSAHVSQAGGVSEANEGTIEDPHATLEAFDWDDLEERYHAKMQECAETERTILDEFHNRIKVFEAWASTISIHESQRSCKRLKTRVSYVQGAEDRLEAKRLHYVKVVQAFESALALLGPIS